MSFYVDSAVVEGLLGHSSLNTVITPVTVASGTLNLANTSTMVQYLTGSTTGQIIKLPDATTYSSTGGRFELWNASSTIVTVKDNGSNVLFNVNANQRALVVCVGIGAAAGTWLWNITEKFASGSAQFTCTYPGTGLAVNYIGGNVDFNGTHTQVASGTVTCPDSTTSGWIYVDTDGTVKATASATVGCVPLYLFTTVGGAITVLSDERQNVMEDLEWGLGTDITNITSGDSRDPGSLKKYARADHQHGTSFLKDKAGTITAVTFTGTPRTASVVFGAAFPTAAYSLSFSGGDGRSWAITSQLTTGFTVSAQANQALAYPVLWTAVYNGESN